MQAQKFNIPGADGDDDFEEEDLEEESLLETPLDKIEPYAMFKHTLLSTYQYSPGLIYSSTNVIV